MSVCLKRRATDLNPVFSSSLCRAFTEVHKRQHYEVLLNLGQVNTLQEFLRVLKLLNLAILLQPSCN